MKYFLCIIISIIATGVLFILFAPHNNEQSPTPLIQSTPIVPPSVQPTQKIVINNKTQQITMSWSSIEDPRRLLLISNHQDKNISAELMRINNCTSGTSANFYDTQNRSLGLFITEGKTIAPAISSNLFNGFFVINNQGAAITTTPPETARIALQSGPVLIAHGIVRQLKLTQDEPARRIVVALTEDTQILFLAAYDAQTPLTGPDLVDLPQLLEEFQKQSGIKITDALNLDGGSASAFYSKEVSLQELSAVGGFFCAQ